MLLAMEKHRLCLRMQLVQLDVAQVLASHPIFTRRHGSQLVNCRRFPGIAAHVSSAQNTLFPRRAQHVHSAFLNDVTY